MYLQDWNFQQRVKLPTFSYDNLSTEQKMALANLSAEDLAKVMETYNQNVNASYESNLETLGAIDLEKPIINKYISKRF